MATQFCKCNYCLSRLANKRSCDVTAGVTGYFLVSQLKPSMIKEGSKACPMCGIFDMWEPVHPDDMPPELVNTLGKR